MLKIITLALKLALCSGDVESYQQDDYVMVEYTHIIEVYELDGTYAGQSTDGSDFVEAPQVCSFVPPQ